MEERDSAMKTYSFFFVIIFSLLIYSLNIYAQALWSSQSRNLHESTGPPVDLKHIPKKLGHYTADDWAAVIDSTWGPGLPTAEKLIIFDEAWNKINAEFAAFQGLDINWDSLGTLYRNEIQDTVSRGRVAAIMNHLSLALHEIHTSIIDDPVMYTPPAPGVPLFYIGSNLANTSRFGATLTPLPDSTALVIKSTINHPIGLEPGDIVLGYDGILWKNLYKELLNAQLPLHTLWGLIAVASDLNSFTHMVLSDVGMNWHLFDTLDVVKYSIGDTLHFPTSSLAGQSEFVWGNEQLPVPGVPWVYQGTANVMDPDDFGDAISWGIVDGTNIGYIYALQWTRNSTTPGFNVSQQFYDAVDSLMNFYNTDGLIIDIRQNYGGCWQYQQGFSLLYNYTFRLFGFDKRYGDPNNHYQMCPYTWPDQYLTTHGDPMTLFDRPIAVLIGPAAVSCGDMSALTIKTHPMARLFGKPTNGAFSTYPGEYNLGGNADWTMKHTNSNCYLLDDPGNYLAHKAFIPDEEVWLTQEDVAKGEDTVVKRAIEWIQNLAHAYDVAVKMIYANPDTAILTAYVENPNQHQLSLTTDIHNLDDVFIDSLSLFDDGTHGDGTANDNIWGNYYLPNGEQSFKVSVTTNDISDETSRTLPNVAWFTTIGPINLDSIEITSTDTIANPGDKFRIKLKLKNEGQNATAYNITTPRELISLDSTVTIASNLLPVYGDIAAGESAKGSISYTITFSDSSQADKNYFFVVDIFSDDLPFWSHTFSVYLQPTGIEDVSKPMPVAFTLRQNYPNPFNPSTKIKFALPKPERVKIEIYNTLGQKIEELLNQHMKAGHHEVEFNAQDLSSGVYYYQLVAGGYREVRKMILIK
jgi:hypothetical protein